MQKHRDAINATVSKTTGSSKRSDKQKSAQKPGPSNRESAPRNTEPTRKRPVPGIPNNWTLIQSKRKNRNGSNLGSDSSDQIKSKSKRSKRSRISETSSSEDEVVVTLPPVNESPRSRHRRMQLDIRAQNTGSKETRQRLTNRTNTKYETVTLTNGRKLTRRNPKIPFKPPRKKPENGASIKEHEPGKMLKAIRIMDRQYAGKLLRFFFNGFGYQLRLAEANRKMQELTLPELRPTKRIKANPEKGLPARLSIDEKGPQIKQMPKKKF